MKTTFKRLTSLIICLVILVNSLPGTVFAVSAPISSTTTNANTQDGVTISKTAAYDPSSGEMKITLEAYTTGTVTLSTRTVPTDIVLVLDVSGSMADPFTGAQNRLAAMKSAVNSFLDQTAALNATLTNPNDMHSVAIVSFASSSTVRANFTTVDTAGATSLKSVINNLSANGATAVDYGLTSAQELLSDRAAEAGGAYAQREKVVIVFTDGDPTHGSSYSAKVAYDAVNDAQMIKQMGAKIYTIGIFNNADPAGTDRSNTFMNYVSSNYPKAYGVKSGNRNPSYTLKPGDGPHNTGYYKTAANASSLNNLFQSISSAVGRPTKALGTSATLLDVVSDYFAIQQIPGDTAPNITIKTADYKGGSDFTSASNWNAPVVADESISYTLSPDGDTIQVKGFDYDTNYLSATARSGNFYGKKLILEIVTKPDYAVIDQAVAAGTLTTSQIPTNDTAAILDSTNIGVAYTTSPMLQANTVTYQVKERDATRTVGTYYRFPEANVDVLAKPTDTAEYTYSDWESSDISFSDGTFTMPSGNVTLVSNASVKQYTVSYEYRGTVPAGADPATAPPASSFVVGESVTLQSVTALAGYEFSGWVEDDLDIPEGQTSFDMPAQNLHFEGYFTALPSTWKVEYYFEVLDDTPDTVDYAETADGFDSFSANTGSTVHAMVVSFPGFEHDAAYAGNITTGIVSADGSLTLKLYYKRIAYPVSYEYFESVNGASQLPPTVSYKFGETVTIAEDATAPGYSFSGWSIRTGATSIEAGKMKMPDSDVVLRGSFTANSGTPYRVEHYFEAASSNDKSILSNYEVKTEYTETFDGVTGETAKAVPLSSTEMIGFTYEPNLSTASAPINGDGSTVLKLYYSRTRHTVTYQYLDNTPGTSELPETVTYKYGDSVTVASEATAIGYAFSGWFSEDVTVSGAGDFTMPAKNVVLSGYFSPAANVYRVEHYLMGTDGEYSAVSDHIHTYTNVKTGDSATATVAEHIGFTYDVEATRANQLVDVAFINDTSGNSVPTTTIAADGSTVLRLYYQRNQYNVSYEYIGTVPPDVIPDCDNNQKVTADGYGGTYYYGEVITIAENASDGANGQNYTFSGWTIRTGDTAIDDGRMIMPNSDVILRGSFTATGNTPYFVEHYFADPNGAYQRDDKKTQTLQGAAGKEVTAVPLSDESVIGYKFNAAKSEQTRTGVIVSTQQPLTLKLYYDRTEHPVKYQYTGDVPADAPNVPAQAKYKYDDTVTIADKPQVQGYTFSGWTPNMTLHVSANNQFSMPAATVEFTGHFEPLPNSYTVEHYLMGTDGLYPATPSHSFTVENVVTGQQVETATTTVTHTGFTFDANTTGEQYQGTVAADGATVLRVYFARDKYKVSYIYNHTDAELNKINPTPATDALLTNLEYYFEQEVTVEPNASAAGYLFTGWSIYTGDIAIENGKFKMPAKDILIHGAFNADPNTRYTVEHWLENLNSSDAGNINNYTKKDSLTQTLEGSTNAPVTAMPQSGDALIGYSVNVALSAATRTGTIAANGSTVLKIYYKLMENDVIYQYSGDVPTGVPDVPAKATYKYGSSVTVADDAELEGYTFSGWKLPDNSNITITNGQFSMPEHTVYLYGSFAPKPSQYTVEHYLMNADGSYPTDPILSVPHTTDVHVGDTVTAAPITSYTAYSYDEVATRCALTDGISMPETAGNDLPSGVVNAAGTLVLKLYYSRNLYDLSYEFTGTIPNGAVPPTTQIDIRHGDTVALAKIDPPAGYIFDGWYHGETRVGDSLVMPEADTVVTGSFVPRSDVKYEVEYWLENLDGSYSKTNDSFEASGTTGAYVFGPRIDFAGFTFNMEKSTWNGHIKGDGSLVLQLYYDRNVHTVNYYYHDTPPEGVTITQDSNKLTISNAYQKIGSAEYQYGQTVSVKPILVASDGAYVFRGWYTPNISGITLNTEMAGGETFVMPDYDVNFYGALYNYIVYYNLNGGTLNGADTIDPKEVEWNEDGLLPEGTPQKDGLIFSGWSCEDIEGYVTNSNKYSELAGSPYIDTIVLVAEYANGYTVTYNWGSENIPDGVELPADSKLYADGESYSVDTVYSAGYTVEVQDYLGNVIGRYTFSGWTDPSNGVINGESVIITGEWTYESAEVDTWTVRYTWINAPDTVRLPATVTGLTNGATHTVDTTYTSDTVIENKNVFGQVLGVWRFSGWDKSGTLTVTGNITISGSWEYEMREIPVTPPIITEGYATLTKVDAEDHDTLLSGVVFELYRSNGAYVGTYTTDNNGMIRVSGLPTGVYYWKEVRSAAGYVLDTSKHQFSVSAGQTTSLVIENEKSKVPGVFIDDHYAYIIGYEDGKVHPEANITRAEVATIFFRLLNETTRNQHMTRANSFFDVNQSNWFNTAVSTMAAMGIVTGYPDGTFRPDANITRAEFAAIAARFDEHGNTTNASFLDIYEHWAKKEISIAANNGWILGYEDGTFRPDQFITRAEAMTMVNRVLQRIPEHVDDLLPDMVIWPDNMDTKEWYYLMVQEATNSHYYGRKTNGYEYWTELREVPDWAALER